MDFNKWIKEGVPYLNNQGYEEYEKKFAEETDFDL